MKHGICSRCIFEIIVASSREIEKARKRERPWTISHDRVYAKMLAGGAEGYLRSLARNIGLTSPTFHFREGINGKIHLHLRTTILKLNSSRAEEQRNTKKRLLSLGFLPVYNSVLCYSVYIIFAYLFTFCLSVCLSLSRTFLSLFFIFSTQLKLARPTCLSTVPANGTMRAIGVSELSLCIHKRGALRKRQT